MLIHLGAKHHVGLMKGSNNQDFGMVAAPANVDQPSEVMSAPSNDAAPITPPPPASEEDAARMKMLHATHAALTAMMDKNQECHEKAEYVEKAYSVANMDVVNGVQQAEISKNNFRKMGVEFERELEGLLAELQTATAIAQDHWNNLIFLLPPAPTTGPLAEGFAEGSSGDGGGELLTLMSFCMDQGVDSQISSSLVSHAMLLNTDYGLTRESYWAEAARVEQILGG